MKNLICKLFGIKQERPTLLSYSMQRFTNSNWMEDLVHYKHINHYLYHGKR